MSQHIPSDTSSQVPVADPISPSISISLQATPSSSHNFSLYNDAVQHVLQYSRLSTLHTAAQLSKQWYHVIRSMKPLQLELDRIRDDRLRSLSTHSIVGLHIGRFSPMLCFGMRSLKIARLSIGEHFPNLKRGLSLLSISSDEMESPQEIQFPRQLEELTIQVEVPQLLKIIHALSELSALTQLTFHFLLDGCFSSSSGGEQQQQQMRQFLHLTSFKPLAKMENLQKLELVFSLSRDVRESMDHTPSVPVPSSLLSCIRTMSSLTSLTFDDRGHIFEWDMNSIIRHLSQQPHNLHQLTTMDFSCVFDVSILESLSRSFPTIQRFTYTPRINPDEFQLLARFLNVIELHLNTLDNPLLTYDGILLAVKSCPRLEELWIHFQMLTNEQLDEILSLAPNLTKLELHFCKHISSLSVLSKYSIPDRLTHFCMRYCGPMKEQEIEHISLLRNLVQLDVAKCFYSPPSQQMRQRVSPRSEQMPNLRLVIEIS